MFKHLKLLSILFLIFLSSLYFFTNDNTHTQIETIEQLSDSIPIQIKTYEQEEIDNSIGNIIIDRLDLNQKLYNINDSKNNIEQHVTILPDSIFPEEDHSIMFIAAHSGTGPIAYFNDLDKLNINDEIKLVLGNNEYTYSVYNTMTVPKDGTIRISKTTNKQLILTTCGKEDDTQLIVESTIKEA